MKRINLVNKKFGTLLVVALDSSISGNLRWLCKCDCGNRVLVMGSNLKRNQSCKVCGYEQRRLKRTRHGKCNTAEYRAWCSMRTRCSKKDYPEFYLYGGRGISVSAEWQNSFDNFYADMGPKPSPNHSLDRIDVNGNYEAKNCRWATLKEQHLNKRNTRFVFDSGKKKTLFDLSTESGLNIKVITDRWDKGDREIARLLRLPRKSPGSKNEFNKLPVPSR